MKTIKQTISAEITVKKSKFIAHIFQVKSEEEAKDIIKAVNKKYHDAKHNCYAYIIEENKVEKSSDNGEPSGTAGAPMLDILKNKNLSNILIVVTRYFGGILLGTGGLVKAYTDASLEALSKAEIIEQELGARYKIELPYSEVRNFEYNAQNLQIKIISINYNETVEIMIKTTKMKVDTLKNNIELKSIELLEDNIYI